MRNMALLAPIVALTALALASCSNRAAKTVETSEAFQHSIQQMNNRDFNGAIASLETLHQAQPENQEVSRRLMHAYAGAAGYETPKYKSILERLVNENKNGRNFKESLEEFKRFHGIQKLDKDHIGSFKARRVTKRFVNAIDDFPLLTKAQYGRLNQAIELYEKAGFSFKTSSKEDNFQWGLLYSYRMLANLRYLADELDAMAESRSNRKNEDVERVVIRAWNMITWDAFNAYKLFRHSYDRLQRIGLRVEEFLSRISGRRINARLLEQSNSAMDIVQYFVDQNRDITVDLFERIEGRIRQGNFEYLLQNAFREFRHETPEVRFHKARMRAVLREYIEEFEAENSSDIRELRELFNDQLRQELRQAYNLSLREESFDPFHRLYRERHSNFRRILDLADYLSKDVDLESLESDLKPHALALRDRVDATQLRLARAELEAAGRDIKNILKDEQALYQENYDYLIRRLGKRLKNVENILNEEIVDPAKPLVDEMSRSDPDFKKKARQQNRRTQRYITR